VAEDGYALRRAISAATMPSRTTNDSASIESRTDR